MKTEVQYRWRVKWGGRWVTTRHHCAEEQIRAQHPEALVIEHTRRELQIPETADEWEACVRSMNTSHVASAAPGFEDL